jgi:hypothetical protein
VRPDRGARVGFPRGACLARRPARGQDLVGVPPSGCRASRPPARRGGARGWGRGGAGRLLREIGGVLDRGRWPSCSNPSACSPSLEESPPADAAWLRSASTPAEPKGRVVSTLHMLGNGLLYGFVGLCALLWYGSGRRSWSGWSGPSSLAGAMRSRGRRRRGGACAGRPGDMPGGRGGPGEAIDQPAPPAGRGHQPVRQGTCSWDAERTRGSQGPIDCSRRR